MIDKIRNEYEAVFHFDSKWDVKETDCYIEYYEEFQLDDVSNVFLSIINDNEGSILRDELATMLGFNVVDNFETDIKRYRDEAEVALFDKFLISVSEWGLVEHSAERINITQLGRYALEQNKKYKFYSANKGVFSHRISALNTDDLFPFSSEFGIESKISNIKEIKYNDVNLDFCFNTGSTELIERLKHSSLAYVNIYKAEEKTHISLLSTDIKIALYSNGNLYAPIVVNNDELLYNITNTVLSNKEVKERKIEEGLYKRLLSDSSAILDYETIIPFADILEVDKIITDSRLRWYDDKLFNYIAGLSDANMWYNISNHCVAEVIIKHIDEYRDNFYWPSLSARCDVVYILDHTTCYPWDFEIVRQREEFTLEDLKRLICIPELRDTDWNWAEIMPQLDIDFIIENIENVDFDLYKVTEEFETTFFPLVVRYPEKCWDWNYIALNYDIEKIFIDLSAMSKYINIEILLDRFCLNIEWSKKLTEKFEIIERMLANSHFSVNEKEYKWTHNLIHLFEQSGHLTWESGIYKNGFECNPTLPWSSTKFFDRYALKVSTEKGYSAVSKNINNTSIILNNPEFKWDWSAISSNASLICDEEFCCRVFRNLHLDKFVHRAEWGVLESLCEDVNKLNSIGDCSAASTIFTNKVPLDYVRTHIDFKWDWNILTKRFCSIVKVQFLGDRRWVNKWNWSYFSHNLDIDDIVEYLDAYSNYWDWDILSHRLPLSTILEYLPEYNDYWKWDVLIDERIDAEYISNSTSLASIATCISAFDNDTINSIWRRITSKLDYNTLEYLISVTMRDSTLAQICYWDYVAFYAMDEFNVIDYLKSHSDVVSWTELSECKKLGDEFFYDRLLFGRSEWIKDVLSILTNSRYRWDYAKLSKQANITWSSSIISDIKLKKVLKDWDWSYISEQAGFLKKDTAKTIKQFDRYIDYKALSKRADTSLKEMDIDVSKDWDWSALTSNESIKISIDFMVENSSKNWDWGALVCRKDIIFSEDVIEKLLDKNLDWCAISQRSDFEPTNRAFELLLDKNLNWEVISQNKKLDITHINDQYYGCLDWSKISRRSDFPIKDIELYGKLWDYVDWYYVSTRDEFPASVEFVGKVSDRALNWTSISKNEAFDLNKDSMNKFESNLDWSIVSLRLGESINNDIVDAFADKIDWHIVSKSQNIEFSAAYIAKYEDRWDWSILSKNPQIENNCIDLGVYGAKLNGAKFLEQFSRANPKIYHFTHLYNAAEIIKSRKILSRNKADGMFANAAGSNVYRRGTAHSYARFYYRPQTPTQFYNECLGMDSQSGYSRTGICNGQHYSKWVSNYPQARTLGLPKCPMPVFFEFDLQEVLNVMLKKCYYSTGNMQTDRAKVRKISDSPSDLNGCKVYSTIEDGVDEYKDYSQQEFLVLEEFDFSSLKNFRIICYDSMQVELLKHELGDDALCSKITCDNGGIYHRDNRELHIENCDGYIKIESDYRDSSSLVARCTNKQVLDIRNPQNIVSESATEIEFEKSIEFANTEEKFEVYFVDKMLGKREWLVYRNFKGSNRCRRSLMTDEMLSLIQKFPLDMDTIKLRVASNLFYGNMLHSHHGIGHTTRVLLYTYILSGICDLAERERKACCVAAIIHDLGKTSDMEGQRHGYNSMCLYKDKIYDYIDDRTLCERVLNAVRYHSVEDSQCPDYCTNDIIWKILKDADALDRSRFSRGCNPKYLRLPIYSEEIGCKLLDFAYILPRWTNECTWEHPYTEMVNAITKQIK